MHGGYGIYYDRVTLEIQSLERGLDGRALPIEVRAGQRLLPRSGRPAAFPPFAPSTANPFSGFILPGAGASGSTSSTTHLQNPSVQQFNLGVQRELPGRVVLRVDGVHDLGTHFIIGRTVGEVFNPVVGGPDRVVNLESSVNTQVRRAARQRRAARHASGFSRVVHVRQGVQLRERRPDSIRQRSDRSAQSRARVRPDAQRPAAPAHGGRVGTAGPAESSWRRSGQSPRGSRWTSSCRMRNRGCRVPAERGRTAVQERGGSERCD